MGQQQGNQEELRELLRQYWLHCRHIETERAWFMNVYAIITGGIITYAFTAKVIALWSIYFLMAFTVIGFLLTWRWKKAFEHFQRQVEDTADKLGVEVDLNVPANWFWKVFGTRYLFLYFYAIIFIGLIIMVATNIFR